MTSKVKPAKGKKGGTESSRNFSYKSFSQKISNLKIDPVRRVRRYVDDEETQQSFFLSAFEKWVELNLSTTFTAFVQEMRPLCESLPLIVHYKDRIFEVLHTYIDKRDALALEPLLDLLAQFAHDLGTEFEPYLPRSVTLLSSLVVNHVEFGTIEWTFNCLAYLLKYLSRLLAPDIRPLYDVLAPLLGRENQKNFVTRFAAEALSFLIRKAKGESLTLIVQHAFEDLQKNVEKPGAAGYPNGLMTMFYEACISIDRTIHSRGPQVFEALLRVVMTQPDEDGLCLKIMQGVLTALIHHTSEETFGIILDLVLGFIRNELLQAHPNAHKLSMAGRLLYTAAGVRKGSRITNWDAIGEVAAKTLDCATNLETADKAAKDAMWRSLKAITMIIQYASLDVVISKCSRTAEKARDWQNGALFISFCDFTSGLSQERFRQFVLPYIKKFIFSQWTAHEEELFLLIPKLKKLGLLNGGLVDVITSESQLTKHTLENFKNFQISLENKDIDADLVLHAFHTLNVLLSLCSKDSTIAEKFDSQLVSLLTSISNQPKSTKLASVAGRALSFTSRANSQSLPISILCDLIIKFTENTVFLSGAYDFIKHTGVSAFSLDQQSQICDSLVSNLSSPSHDARRTVLQILELFSKTWTGESADTPDLLRTLGMIEDTPFTIPNQRNLAMYVRKLGMEYRNIGKESRYRQIVPWYCFGLMTIKFAPMWEDAAKALAMVVETNEELVAELAFNWLTGKGLSNDDAVPTSPDVVPHFDLTPFQCSNLEVLELSSQNCTLNDFALKASLGQQYENDTLSHNISLSTARSQALQVLCKIPQVAERRSRLLVPLFLEWSTRSAQEGGEEQGILDTATGPKWARKDQIVMLTLFSKFTNPRSLFKSEPVFASLLDLLTTGDAKVQSLALKCILTWKTPAIKAYGDRLSNLLDDTMFRDELTHFVQVDEDESTIENQHRPALMPVLLRILYGRSLSRKHASSGKKGMSSTRTAILASLVNLRSEEQTMFIEIAFGELANVNFVDRSDPVKLKLNMEALGSIHFSLRKQVGLVRMVEDLLKQLGANLLPHLSLILDAVLYCLVSSVEALKTKEAPEDEADRIAAKALKEIRISGFKCLNGMFHFCPTFDWKPYMSTIFEALVNPRLEKFPVETAQSVSGLLTLFATWANSKHTIMILVDYNDKLIDTIAQCVIVESVKDEVVLFIVKLLMSIVNMANNIDESMESTATAIQERIIKPNVDMLLDKLADILSKNLKKEVLEQCIETVAVLAPFVSSTTETTRLVKISVFLLDQPSRRVNPKTKSDVLKIMVNALPNCVMEKGDELYESIFRTISSLFGFFRDRESRQILAGVLNVFAERDPELKDVAELSRKLNAFSTKRLDEPDFEQRLEAYGTINETLYNTFSAKQWMPIVHNMFFFIRDNEELAIRTNASYTLKRFAEVSGKGNEYLAILTNTILPIIRNGSGEQSEHVRQEYVSVMAHIVKSCPTLEEVKDLQPLLMNADEEASFFNNVLHIQQHRRQRALRRLATIATKSRELQTTNISKFLVPLIEHFVFDAEEDAHNLAHEAVLTIGALAQQLQWTQWRALLRRYLGYVENKPEMAKVVIRLVGVVVDALVRACEDVGEKKGTKAAEDVEVDEDEDMEKEQGKEETNGDVEMAEVMPKCRLAETIPEHQKLGDEIVKEYLPILTAYLHKKDDSTVALRVPVAISVVKLLKIIPEDMMKTKLPGVLMDICHILRSRAQDDRDMTRKTLSEIALLLGPRYISFILKELRGSLQRGYQLHVRSFTVHSMLVTIVPKFPAGSLDYCASPIVDIIMDDIFGVTGSEKDAEGYISKMKEVKSSKSYDSMEIMAQITTLPYLGKLVRPIKSLLQERLDLKLIKKIDELLRRTTVGLSKNKTLNDRDLLVFCYEIVQEAYKSEAVLPKEVAVDEKRARYLINLKTPSKEQSKVATSSNVFKLTKFALDILRTLLAQHEDLMTPENLAGFIPILGDSILSKQEEVQVSAMRMLTAITRVPLPAIDDSAHIFVDKAVSFVKSCPSTNAELAQASLKLISAILRERRSVTIKETTIGYILTRIEPDLEEPDRQGVTFKFLKSILSRKIQVPEVYTTMDSVAAIMVTNQTRSVCDSCRSLYFTFLMDYPQGPKRWKKQLAFLVGNLEYKHEAGRKSVLEAIHSVVTKMGDGIIQSIVNTFFVPLVMVLVNDDSAECRQMTGLLIKEIWRRANDERRAAFLTLLRTWGNQEFQPLLVRVALQVYGLYFEVVGAAGKGELSTLMPQITAILATIPIALSDINDANEESEPADWEILYFTLQLYTKLLPLFPEQTLSGATAPIWASIRQAQRYPHAWIRLTSSTLIGHLFSSLASSGAPLDQLPLKGPHGLEMGAEDLLDIAYRTSGQLNSPTVTAPVATQVVKNLHFLTRVFAATNLPATNLPSPAVDEADDEEEEEPEPEPEPEPERMSALAWLLSRLAGIIRSERNIKLGLLSKRSSLSWVAALIKLLDPTALTPLSLIIIRPLFNLTELPPTHTMHELKPVALEILETLQGKLGTTEYIKAYSQVKRGVVERRAERRGKRKILAVARPEVAARKKVRKGERKKEGRKEKSKREGDKRRGRLL